MHAQCVPSGFVDFAYHMAAWWMLIYFGQTLLLTVAVGILEASKLHLVMYNVIQHCAIACATIPASNLMHVRCCIHCHRANTVCTCDVVVCLLLTIKHTV